MAKRPKQNSDDIFIAVLMSLPWWVPFALAALAYAVISRFTVLGAFLWACIFVFAGLSIPFIRQKRNELLLSAADLPAIRQMSWQRFEALVSEAFRQKGYVVVELGGAGPDGGIDLILHKGTEKIIVQCKHWTKPVGVAPVRELRGVVAREKARRGIFVTSSSYTEDALAEAKGQPLELIDGPKLLQLIHTAGIEVDKSPQEIPSVLSTAPKAVFLSDIQAIDEIEVPFCPVCGSIMKRRTARQGASAGSDFWGCSQYPPCRGKRQIQQDTRG